MLPNKAHPIPPSKSWVLLVDQNGRSSEHQGRIKLTILSLRGTSGERTEERGSEQERASSPHPLLHLMEEREKSTSLMQACVKTKVGKTL